MKKNFSERVGITKPNIEIQLNSMTKELRNVLWNTFDIYYLSEAKDRPRDQSLVNSYLHTLAINLWMYHFKIPLDNLPYFKEDFISKIRDYFFKTDWNRVYNFLDFCLEFADGIGVKRKEYIDFTNNLLREELSGYRIVGDCFAPITNEEQIKSIDKALELTKDKNLDGVFSHISASIQLLSNRDLSEKDKYRNTIKEAISSVEGLCNKLNNKKSDGLKGALKLLKSKINIHGALEEGFIRLYGYTSDSDGIRHPILDEPDLDIEDAIYMLVTCSAFVNYLIQKSIKVGLIK